MKTFNDIEFKEHPKDPQGFIGQLFFDNGYGISVIRFKERYGSGYGSYTSNESEWECAILKGNKDQWYLCYDTPLTDDVIGHLNANDVTYLMKQIQEL
jgi:hypothetical protein